MFAQQFDGFSIVLGNRKNDWPVVLAIENPQDAVMRAELSGAEEFGPVWDLLVDWAQQNNHDIDASQPSYEIYLNHPDEHPDKHHIISICLSVKPG